jgi:hypothetical protein
MRQTNARTADRYAVCIQNDGYPVSLDVDKPYPALPDPDAEGAGMLRVIDESGDDYLYPASRFRIVEAPNR